MRMHGIRVSRRIKEHQNSLLVHLQENNAREFSSRASDVLLCHHGQWYSKAR